MLTLKLMILEISTLVVKSESILKLQMNKVFWGKGHSPLNPLCPLPQNGKQNLILFKRFAFANQRKTYTSANNEYPVPAFLQKPPPKFFFRSATEKLRILVTLWRNHSLRSFLFAITASEIIPVLLVTPSGRDIA